MSPKLLAVGWLIIGVLAFSQSASGSGNGLLNVGSFTRGAGHDTGWREWIQLTGAGGLLSGRPALESVELITIYAPGCDEGHLILRKLRSPDGRESLLLTAPDELREKMRRATIYLKPSSVDMVLLEYVKGEWKTRLPYSLHTEAEEHPDSLQQQLLAFSVEELGFYWLLPRDAVSRFTPTFHANEPSASRLLGGGMYRGLLPWVWSVVVVVVIWSLSSWIHRREQLSGE